MTKNEISNVIKWNNCLTLLEQLDDIYNVHKTHQSLKKEIEQFRLYPRHELYKMSTYHEIIKEICEHSEIEYYPTLSINNLIRDKYSYWKTFFQRKDKIYATFKTTFYKLNGAGVKIDLTAIIDSKNPNL